MLDINTLKFDEQGLIPGIVQSPGGEVRMFAFLSRESLQKTFETGFVTFWSRSRKSLWMKGESSGNRLKLVDIRPDCDRDALLIIAEAEGPTCHTGAISCFEGDPLAQPWLEQLEELLKGRKANASNEGSYTQKLFAKGVDRIAKKVTEEAGEVIIAAKNYELDQSEFNRTEYLGEAADLLFHLQVLLTHHGLSLKDIATVLRERHRQRS